MKFNFKIQKYQTEAKDNFIQLKKRKLYNGTVSNEDARLWYMKEASDRKVL